METEEDDEDEEFYDEVDALNGVYNNQIDMENNLKVVNNNIRCIHSELVGMKADLHNQLEGINNLLKHIADNFSFKQVAEVIKILNEVKK